MHGYVRIAIHLFAFLSVAPGVSLAQTGTNATIQGTVTDAATGVAVADHPVLLEHPDGEIAAKTDSLGRFSVTTHLTGRCRVAAEKGNGYLRSSRTLEVQPGESLRGIDLKLIKAALIAGRVTDASGAPVGEGFVNLRLEGRIQGRRTLIGSWTRPLDGSGRFRFDGLGAGRYTLSVTPKPIEFKEIEHSEVLADPPEPRIVNAITYHPNSPAGGGALPVVLNTGQVSDGIEVTLVQSYGVCLTTILPSRGNDWIGLTLSETYPMSQSRVAFGRFRPATPVRACGLTPGEYRLTAFTKGEDGQLAVAVEKVAIVGRKPVTLPPLQVAAFARLTGSVLFSAPEADSAARRYRDAKMTVTLHPKDRLPWTGESLTGPVSADGRFEIPAVLLDDYWVTVSGLPERHYVKSIRSGVRDAYAIPLRVGSGDVVIDIGGDGPILTGAVQERSGDPVADATVVLVPASGGASQPPNRTQTARTDGLGQFTLAGMPPGDYRIAAFRGLTPFLEHSESILEAAATAGRAIALEPNTTKHAAIEAKAAGRHY